MGEGNGEENGREREEWLSMCMCVLLTNSSVAFFLSSLSFSSSLVDLDSYWSDYSHCKQRREKEKEKKESEKSLSLSPPLHSLFPPSHSLSLLSTLSSQARLPYTRFLPPSRFIHSLAFFGYSFTFPPFIVTPRQTQTPFGPGSDSDTMIMLRTGECGTNCINWGEKMIRRGKKGDPAPCHLCFLPSLSPPLLPSLSSHV